MNPARRSVKTANSSLTLRQNNEITMRCFLCSDCCFLNHSWHVIYLWMRGRKTKWHVADSFCLSFYYLSSPVNSQQIENKNNNHRAGKPESLCLSREWRQKNNDEAEIGLDAMWRLFSDPLKTVNESLQQENKYRIQHEGGRKVNPLGSKKVLLLGMFNMMIESRYMTASDMTSAKTNTSSPAHDPESD